MGIVQNLITKIGIILKKIKPFFVKKEVYYEVTFTEAVDEVSKFDRVIAFTKLEIPSNYAVKLKVSNDSINIFDKEMPIQIIDEWEVSIRPCELKNFAKIFGKNKKILSNSKEFRNLMSLLTETKLNLVEVIDFPDSYYQRFKTKTLEGVSSSNFFEILDEIRSRKLSSKNGNNIIRYLLFRLNNKIIKLQYSVTHNHEAKLPGLKLHWGCIPFDEMPFVTSPLGHNPKIYDLLSCIDIEGHEHELFARLIKNNTENKGLLYTPTQQLDSLGDVINLKDSYNNKLYGKHKPKRELQVYKDHIFMNEYEQNTYEIIENLKALSRSGISNYSNSVQSWLDAENEIDCDHKKQIIKDIFEQSHVCLIYGAAGTGKTKLIGHISNFFHGKEKLFLANTHPAKNNLKERVKIGKSTFKTVGSFLHESKIMNTNMIY